MTNRRLFAIIIGLIGILLIAWSVTTKRAHGRQMGEYSVKISPECAAKIKKLERGGFNCCATAYGGEAREAIWDMKRGRHVVVIDKQEYDVPESTVLTEPNCAGIPIVWYYWLESENKKTKDLIFRCFWPGAGL